MDVVKQTSFGAVYKPLSEAIAARGAIGSKSKVFGTHYSASQKGLFFGEIAK
jgi:hypothetical protein